MRAYLDLTDAQIAQIALNLKDYGTLIEQRQQRIYQVQSELRDEAAKSPLEPSALGIRYAEIETICRNVSDEATAVQNKNLALLTSPQKVKLKALEDAYKLLPIITETQNAGVLAPPTPYSSYLLLGGLIFSSSTTTPVLPGCQQPEPRPNLLGLAVPSH